MRKSAAGYLARGVLAVVVLAFLTWEQPPTAAAQPSAAQQGPVPDRDPQPTRGGGLQTRPAAGNSPLAGLTGPELIARLQEANTRLAAFRELARSGGKEKPEELDSAEVISCPQSEGKKPVYVVLTNFSWRPPYESRYSGDPNDRPEELFGPRPAAAEVPIASSGRLAKRSNLVIYAFAGDGSVIHPFGGDNMMEHGIIADLNSDGLIERADLTNYGVEGARFARVFEIQVVREKAVPLLAVLYDWGDHDDWDYQFADANDGTIEIQFGPVIGGGAVKPKAVFRWDKTRKAYIGPEGKGADHFRVLNIDAAKGLDAWAELNRLKAAGSFFAADPEAKGTSDSGFTESIRFGTGIASRGKPSPPPPKPYRYASLKGLSNEQLAAYMGPGKKQYEFEQEQIVKTSIPKEFWTLPPKDAAIAMAEVNRSPEHRKAYRMAIDDRDGQKPPETCWLYYSYRSRRCYITRDSKYFLRVDPNGSYLACSSVGGLGVVFYNVIEAHPVYDLRFLELKYEDARQIAQNIWWMNRIRTLANEGDWGLSGLLMSTADGSGALRITAAEGREVDISGTVWAGAVSERWGDKFGSDTLLNLADYLLQTALPERLGKQWEDQARGADESHMVAKAMGFPVGTQPAEANAARVAAERRFEKTRARASQLIGLFSPDESRMAYSILTDAVGAVGEFAMADLAPSLKALQKAMPPPTGPARTREVVEREWRSEDGNTSMRAWQELMPLEHGTVQAAAREELREAVELSLHQIEAANEPDVLQAWGQSDKPGWQWAMQRLRQTDKKRYVAALEWWMQESKGKWTRQIFDAIQEIDPQRARELAAQVPATQKGDLTVSAYSTLEKAKALADANQRIDALIQVALDPKSGWQQRGEAIDLLVPVEAPLSHPDRKIDEALVKLLNPALGDDILNFTQAHACAALALRGRLEQFDRITDLLPTLSDGEIDGRVVTALVRLAQTGSGEHRTKLIAVLRPQLKQTRGNIEKTFLFLFALDARQTRAEIEALGTSGPEDYEEEKAYSYSSIASAVAGHYHGARQVAAVWNEEDPPTRAKLLFAFGLSLGGECEGVALPTIRRQLKDLAGSLPAKDLEQVVGFVDWYETNASGHNAQPDGQKHETDLGKFVRETFKTGR